MNFKIALIINFITFGLSQINAQNYNIAYILTKASGNLGWQDVNSNLIKELNETYAYDLFFYNYNVNKELSYAPALNGNKEEKAARYLRSYDIDLMENYYPELMVSLDTNKNVTGVFFQLNNATLYRSKTTDISTSQIIQNNRKFIVMTDEAMLDFKSRINVPEWKTLFGGNPNTLKTKDPKKYNIIVGKLHDSNREKILSYHKQKGELINKTMVNEQLHLLDNEIPVVKNPVIDKEKLNKFVIMPEKKGSKYVAAYTSVFTLDTFNNYIYSTQQSLFVGNTEKDGSIVFSRAPFKSGKEAAQAVAAGKTLYYSIGSQGYGDKLKEESKVINLGINTPDPDFNASMELYFNKLKDVKLFDISNKEIINKIRDHYKGGAFMNDALEVKEQGLTHMLTTTEGKAQITNVENGNVIGSFNLDDRYPVVYNALMDALKLNMEVIMITKEKKGKAEELLLYAPLGFTNVEKLEVFSVDIEKVNGKELERRTKIGELKASNETFDEAKGRSERREVKDGEKEIFEAVKAGKKLIIRVSEKTGMFGKLNQLDSKLGKLNTKK